MTFIVKNHKTSLKEIKEDTKRKTSYVHEFEDFILLRCQYYSKEIYRFRLMLPPPAQRLHLLLATHISLPFS